MVGGNYSLVTGLGYHLAHQVRPGMGFAQQTFTRKAKPGSLSPGAYQGEMIFDYDPTGLKGRCRNVLELQFPGPYVL